jgi:hypothetical protein
MMFAAEVFVVKVETAIMIESSYQTPSFMAAIFWSPQQRPLVHSISAYTHTHTHTHTHTYSILRAYVCISSVGFAFLLTWGIKILFDRASLIERII